MIKQRKSEISIFIVFSVIITIIGISLLLLVIGQNRETARKTYCLNEYDSSRRDDFCEEYLKLATNRIKLREEQLQYFKNQRARDYINLTQSNNFMKKTSVELPKNAHIKNATLKISLAEKQVTLFEGETPKLAVIVPLGRPIITKLTDKIPLNTYVTDSKFEISGASYPTKADIVFIIDTSGSMGNEWAAVCATLKSINEKLRKLGLDVNVFVYALDHGGTYGKCIDVNVTESELINTLLPFGLPQWNGKTRKKDGPDCPYRYDPYDEFSEAWAVGVAWLASNFQWRQEDDVKRIIIPISDSDPSGGGRICQDNKGEIIGEAAFSGTEQRVINEAIARCSNLNNWIYTLPIHGDEGGESSEGFGVGSEICYPGTSCNTIINWMHELAVGTGAIDPEDRIIGFSDENDILEAVLKVMTSPFPSNITVNVENQKVWNFTPALDNTTSPQVIHSDAVSDATRNCVGKECGITVQSDEGIILLDRLRIRYWQDPNLTSINVSGYIMDVSNKIDYLNPNVDFDVKDLISNALQHCNESQQFCTIDIEAMGSQEGHLDFEIFIEYEYYNLEQDLVYRIMNCWKQSNSGQAGSNFMCDEIIIPKDYVYYYPINEERITQVLKDRKLCHIISNLDYGCGDQDDIVIAQDIYNTTNMLIEYKDRKVVIS